MSLNFNPKWRDPGADDTVVKYSSGMMWEAGVGQAGVRDVNRCDVTHTCSHYSLPYITVYTMMYTQLVLLLNECTQWVYGGAFEKDNYQEDVACVWSVWACRLLQHVTVKYWPVCYHHLDTGQPLFYLPHQPPQTSVFLSAADRRVP